MKILLYCVKAKPYLVQGFTYNWMLVYKGFSNDRLNGKIVAECDFEVEKITNYGTSFMIMKYDDLEESYRYTNKIARDSCLDYTDLKRYLGTNNGYAIHIENLHIFDEPLSLFEISKESHYSYKEYLPKYFNAPQNMCYCWYKGEKYILISIRPKWLCKILNCEKTIECRKRILKEMLSNERDI